MKIPRFSPATLAPFSVALLATLPCVTRAATLFWDGTGTSWNSAGSWSTAIGVTTDPAAVPVAADTATFSINGLNTFQTVNLDANQAASALSFNLNATGGVALQGGGTDRTLTLGTGGIGINAATGAVTIGSASAGQGVSLILTGSQSWANNGSALLTINNGVTNSATTTITLSGSGSGGVTINGAIANGTGTIGLTVNNASGGSVNTLTGANTYTGSTTVTKGTLVVSGATGALGNTTTTISNGGVLILDDRGTANANRMGTSGITLNNGSSFRYIGSDQTATNSTETVGAITLGSGVSNISVAQNSTNSATLTAGAATGGFTRTAGSGGIALINGANLGAGTVAGGSVGQFITSTSPTLVGTTNGGTTGINASAFDTKIARFVVGESGVASGQNGTATGVANTFLTYNATTGYRPLNPTDEFVNNVIATGANTYLSSGTTATAGTTAINSLVVNGGNLSIAAGETLTDTSGMLLFAQNGSIGGDGTFALGQAEGIVLVNSGVNASIGSVLSTGATGLTVYGGGTLTLSGANTYSGTTTLNTGATLVVGNDGALGSSTVAFGNSTLKVDSQARTIGNKLNVSGPSTLGGSGDLTLNGSVAVAFVSNSTAFLNVTGTGVTTVSGGFSLNNAASGNYNNNGEGVALGSSANLVVTGAVTDNNAGNIGSGAAGSLLTLKFTGTGANVSLTPVAANNGFGGNSTAVNVVNGVTSSTYTGYNTITIDGPGSSITPFGLMGLTSNTNAGAIAFIQAASSGKTLATNISTGASVGSGSGFGFAGVNDLTLGGNLSTGSTSGGAGAAFFNLASGDFTFAGVVSQNTGGTAGSAPATFTIVGPGDTIFAGTSSLTETSANNTGSLAKVGSGTLTLAGTNGLRGSSNFSGGTVVLDYTAANASRLTAGTTASALTLSGADLQLKGGSHAQTLGTGGGTTLGAGQSRISRTGGGTSTIALGAITRNAGSAVDFQSGVASTTTSNTGGILGGYATVGGVDWAVGGGTIAALSGYDSFATPGTNKNILQTDGGTVAASTTVNSLKLATTAGGQSLAIGSGQTLSLTTGGLLFTGADDYAITGGTLKPVANPGDLIVQHYGAGTLTIGSVIANGGGTSTLTKAGTGTLALTGANTYTGATFVDGGVLQVSADNNLGAGTTAALTLNGGTLQATAGFSTARTVSLGGNGGTFQVDAGTLAVSGVVSSGSFGSLTKTGAGTLLLSGANTFKGAVNVNDGTLRFGNAAALGASAATSNQSMSPVTVNGGSLDIAGFGANLGNVTLAGGSIVDSVGTGSLAAYGFTLKSGSVGASLADMVIAGNLNNAINVEKTTSGTVTLSGANTYTGNTTVRAGTLLVDGSLSSASAVYVQSGGRIGGQGSVGAVNFASGAGLAFNLATVAQAGDGLTAAGFSGAGIGGFTVFLSGAAAGFDSGSDYTWTVLTADSASITALSLGSIAVDTSGFGQSFAGTFNLSKDATSLYLNYVGSAVPEPASYATLAGAALFGVAMLRRRRIRA